jgi:prepilin-type N-terminal cleavage/methylation domain
MKLQQRGFTFIEVLITTAISVVGASLFFFFAQQVRMHKSDVDYSLGVKELLADNIVEIKGAKMTDIPTASQCLIRTYTNKKVFVSETLSSTSPCPASTIAKNQFQIMWEVKNTQGITATFSNSGLQLPTDSNPLREIIVHAWFFKNPTATSMDHNQIVIFKR